MGITKSLRSILRLFCLKEGGGYAREDACDRFLDKAVGLTGIGYIKEGYIERFVGRNEVAVEAIGFADAPALPHAIDCMPQFFLRHSNEKLRTGGGAT